MQKLMQYALGLAALAAVHCQAGASTFTPFTSITAPDQPARQALANPAKAVPQGVPDVNAAIHKNLPLVIEQNFARLDVPGAAMLVDNLTDKELSKLAQLYNQSNSDTGHKALLLPILAYRLDGARLGRLSQHFGYAPVYAAVVAHAPSKVEVFNAN